CPAMASSWLTARTGPKLATSTFGCKISPQECRSGLRLIRPQTKTPASHQTGALWSSGPNGTAAGSISPKCQGEVSGYSFLAAGIRGFHLTAAVLFIGWVIGTKRSLRGDYFFCPLQVVHPCASSRFPVWSPDGQYILFMGCRMGNQPLPMCSEWWVTSLDQTRVQNTGGLALLRKEQILPMDVGGWYRNAILFSGRRGATTSLWELPIFEANLRASGKPQQLTAGD